jgi:hypothetical protein
VQTFVSEWYLDQHMDGDDDDDDDEDDVVVPYR